MNEPPGESQSLRAFVRGAWLLLIVQLMVAVFVFVVLAGASERLNLILAETVSRQHELTALRTQQKDLQKTLGMLRNDLQHARDATPFVRNAINAFHGGRYSDAIAQYQQALRLDAGNWYITDLLSYSQYMAGSKAARDGKLIEAAQYLDGAVSSVEQVVAAQPDYVGAYIELAVYECARNRPEAALAAYDAALKRTPTANEMFVDRAGEIPARCRALHKRLAAR